MTYSSTDTAVRCAKSVPGGGVLLATWQMLQEREDSRQQTSSETRPASSSGSEIAERMETGAND